MNINHILRVINFPNFRYYFSLLKNDIFKKHSPINLGRWKLEDCKLSVNKKIDWSNYDHCGVCGKNIIDSLNNLNDKKNKHN